MGFFHKLYDALKRSAGARNIPPEVREMFKHQMQTPKIHEIFGKVAPYGIDIWKTSTELTVAHELGTTRASVNFLICKLDSRVEQQNFGIIKVRLDDFVRQFLAHHKAETDFIGDPPEAWPELAFEFYTPAKSITQNLRWSAESGNYSLFFEGVTLKGIVGNWDDPESHGFDPWD